MIDLLPRLRERITSLGISPEKGLGEELFLFVSSLVPIVNVDLLVFNSKGQFLLTRRNDSHCGNGWHVPGGCVRLKETFDERIREVANLELGLSEFTYNKEPLKVFEIFSEDNRDIACQSERSHFVSIVFKCYASDSFIPNNGDKKESDVGFIKWFDSLPDDFLTIQSCYKELLK